MTAIPSPDVRRMAAVFVIRARRPTENGVRGMAERMAPSLEDRIAALRERHGDALPLDRLAHVVEELMQGLDAEEEDPREQMARELRALVDFIERAKSEIVAIRPKTMSSRRLPGAREEIDAVVAHTEKAADRIMDAAERLGEIAGRVEDEELSNELQEVSTEIFEASSFQDITGQRLTKVMDVLQHVEERLAALAEAIGDEEVEEESAQALDESGEVVNEEALTHGPQLEGQGNSQAEIDALLADFD